MHDRLQPAEVEVTRGAASCPRQRAPISAALTKAATSEEADGRDP